MKTFKYNTKLAGVAMIEGAQAVISTLKGDEELTIYREPNNKYDKRAVAVDVRVGEDWIQIGYIAKDKNKQISEAMDGGVEPKIKLASITGGQDGRSYGVNIELEYTEAPAKAEEPVEEESNPVIPSRGEMKNVLEYLLAKVHAKPVEAEPTVVSSVLLGKNIEVQENNGHISLDGYMSGSRFPAQFYAEFDKDGMLQAIVDKHFEEGQREKAKAEIEAMWGINNLASTGFGTAVHAALENYDKNHGIGDKTKSVKKFKTKPDEVGANKALNRNPILKKIVEDFHEKFGGDYIRFNEEFIWDKGLKLCGSVDRIKVVDLKKRIIRIQDFKTDADIHEKKYQLTDSIFYPLTQGKDATMGKELLDYHWLQLSFYAFILQRAGWTVEGLDIYWLNGEKLVKGENPWEEFSHDVIDISEAIIGE